MGDTESRLLINYYDRTITDAGSTPIPRKPLQPMSDDVIPRSRNLRGVNLPRLKEPKSILQNRDGESGLPSADPFRANTQDASEEKCRECGVSIPTGTQAMVWRDAVVCVPCHDHRTKEDALKRAIDEHAQARNWGLHTNAVFDLAMFYWRDEPTTVCRRLLMAGLYLDVNGPDNLGEADDEILREAGMRAFNPAQIKWVSSNSMHLADIFHDEKTGVRAARTEFLEVAAEWQQKYNTPLSPMKAWRRILPELRACGAFRGGD